MNTLSYHPVTKQQIKDLLAAHLYGAIQDQLKKKLESIIRKNSQLLSSQYLSFVYKGQIYASEGERLPRVINRLIPELHGEMDEYLKSLQDISEREVPLVVDFISQVLGASNDLHDYLRVLPSCVHAPIQRLIDTCPCRTKKLTDTDVQELTAGNEKAIEMMRRRLVSNLLIG